MAAAPMAQFLWRRRMSIVFPSSVGRASVIKEKRIDSGRSEAKCIQKHEGHPKKRRSEVHSEAKREENDDISRSPPAHRVRTAGASLRQCGIRRAVWPGQSEEGSQVFAMGRPRCNWRPMVHLAGRTNGDGEGIGLITSRLKILFGLVGGWDGLGAAHWRREHRRTAAVVRYMYQCVRCAAFPRQPRLRGLIMC